MQFGKLKHKFTFASPLAAKDAYGEEVLTFLPVAQPFGSLQSVAGRESFSGSQILSEVSHMIRVRYCSQLATLAPSWRVLFGSRTFDVTWVDNVDARNRELAVYVTEKPGAETPTTYFDPSYFRED